MVIVFLTAKILAKLNKGIYSNAVYKRFNLFEICIVSELTYKKLICSIVFKNSGILDMFHASKASLYKIQLYNIFRKLGNLYST